MQLGTLLPWGDIGGGPATVREYAQTAEAIGFEDGLPLAFQIPGKPFDETGVPRVGHAFERATEFHRHRPPIATSLPGRDILGPSL